MEDRNTRDYDETVNNSYLNERSKIDYKEFNKYKSDKLDKVYEKFKVVKSYSPAKQNKDNNREFSRMIDEYNTFEPTRETLSIKRSRFSNTLTRKNAIYCLSLLAVIIMLVVVIVVNSTSINKLNQDIAFTESQVELVETNINTIIGEIEDLTLVENIYQYAQNNQMEEINPDNIEKIDLLEIQVDTTYQGQTNIFDVICNFISSLFGGW